MVLDDATKNNIREHIMNHHDGFPVTKAKLVEACNNMGDFSEEVKNWFASTLPESTYNNAGEVLKALGM